MTASKAIFLDKSGEWVAVGMAPALLGAFGDELTFVIAEQAPDPDDAAGFILRFGSSPVVIPAHGRIWARASVGSRNARAVIATLSGNADGSLAAVSPPSSRSFK
jgi:hypothetical protein